MRKKKRLCALLLCMAMLLGCTGCGSSTSSGNNPNDLVSTAGKDVTRAAAADNVFSLNCNNDYSFNPLIATNHSNQLVCSLVYENMVELDNSFEVIPNLLTSWICNEEATYWTFEIAEGHYFSDGTPVTGRDLRYSLDAAINSDRFRGRFASYQGSGYDDTRFYVSLGIGDTQFVKLLNIPIVKYGTYGDPKPIGSGPYMYSEDETYLVASPYYPDYENLPIDTVFLVKYTDAASRITAFDDGIIDVVTNDPSSYTNLGYASTSEIHNYATTNYHYVMFNEESTIGRFNGFRQAMNYAFDRAYFADELMHGNAAASAVPMYPTCADYPQQYADSLAYNLETCRLVLENSGIKDYDNDGKLEYMSGSAQKIELKFIVCSDSSAKTGVVRKFASDMETLGLTVNVQELTWENYIQALEDGDFDMYYGEVKLRNNFDVTELLDPDSDLNYSRGKDSSFVGYINDYLAAGDTSRSAMFQQMCQYIAGTGSLISIGFETHQFISHRGVIKGVNPNAGNPLYDFPNWEIMMD